MKHEIWNGDCLEILKKLENNSVDSVVTDPPYGISFMGKKWDYDVPQVAVWKEVMRVLKPGGHALVACGTRTQHRMAVNLEDAGFEIRDIVAWVYGSGFPKSLNVGVAIDKLQGNEREVVGEYNPHRDNSIRQQNVYNGIANEGKGGLAGKKTGGMVELTKAGSKDSEKYEGWGTALKPAMELWTLCRKPLEEKTVAKNVLKYGTGGINIDDCRVESEGEHKKPFQPQNNKRNVYSYDKAFEPTNNDGRFPANLIHDGSDEVVGLFPNDTSRFFYCAKASKGERNKGLEGFEEKLGGSMVGAETREGKPTNHPMRQNFHPTVKPIKLMQYLCRLITPKGGTILDPFTGSGSTGCGAVLEGFSFIGIEREEEYVKIAKARIQAHAEEKQLTIF